MPDTDSRLTLDAELHKGFVSSLLEDVIDARQRIAKQDNPTNRRTIIRTTFAAIEGMTWLYREHVRFIAKRMDVLAPTADMALRERTFTVADNGNIVEQVRFVTLPTIIKLTNRQAQHVAPGFSLEFAGEGWSALKAALSLRHRITHPKTLADLAVDDDDLEMARIAFEWISTSTEAAMTAVNAAFRQHVAAMRTILADLVAGDEHAVAAYRAAALRDTDE